jgi:protein TonB
MKISFSKISVILSGLVHLGLILLLLASAQSSTSTSDLEIVEFVLYDASQELEQEVRVAQVRIPKQRILQSEQKEESVKSKDESKTEELGSAFEEIAQAASEGSPSNTKQARLAENAQELYIAEVIRHLNSQKRYPEIARKLRQQGRVILEFRLSKDGSVLEAKIKEPSTYQLLNESA